MVNDDYYYKLDIINGTKVLEFCNEILDNNKIASIIVWPEKTGMAAFGFFARDGIVLIYFKKGIKFNPKVAGLRLVKKGISDNLNQRKKGEIMPMERNPMQSDGDH